MPVIKIRRNTLKSPVRHPGRVLSGFLVLAPVAVLVLARPSPAVEPSGTRVYENTLTPIKDPKPILADHPVVWAASLIVKPSIRRPKGYHERVKVWVGHPWRVRHTSRIAIHN